MLAVAQLQATPRQVAISIDAIVTSFSLMVAMLIMVGSFRQSLDGWLVHMLPADLYVRAARAGEMGFFTPEQQAELPPHRALSAPSSCAARRMLLAPGRRADNLAGAFDRRSHGEQNPATGRPFGDTAGRRPACRRGFPKPPLICFASASAMR